MTLAVVNAGWSNIPGQLVEICRLPMSLADTVWNMYFRSTIARNPSQPVLLQHIQLRHMAKTARIAATSTAVGLPKIWYDSNYYYFIADTSEPFDLCFFFEGFGIDPTNKGATFSTSGKTQIIPTVVALGI